MAESIDSTSDAPAKPAPAKAARASPSPKGSVVAPIAVASLLGLAAAAVMVARSSGMPTADWLSRYVSTDALDPVVADYAEEVLVVPFGALITVFVRLTLGIRMLGPFRPVLIAMALEFTGVVVGVAFVSAVLVIIAVLRPRLKSAWMPYASRLSIILVTVVILQTAFVFLASAQGWTSAVRSVFFPIIVLCLAADGFARVLHDDGFREATWRGTTTIAVALTITLAFDLPGVAETLVVYPELMLVHIAVIILISRFGAPGWLEGWNPLRRGRPQSEEKDE